MFSSENDVSISQMKQNIYKTIESGNWWNLEAYFANLTSALKEKDAKMTETLKKGMKNKIYILLTKCLQFVSILLIHCRCNYPYCWGQENFRK